MKKQIYTSAALLLLSLTGLEALGQSKIKDNTITGTSSLPRAGSILELESSNKGAMMPRVSLTSTTTWGLLGIDSAGMVVYNNNPAIAAGSAVAPILGGGVGFYYWDGDRWVGMSAGAGTGDYWRLKGNAGTTPPTTVGTAVGAANYWGTTDAQNLAVGTNGITRAIFDQNGSMYGGIGTYDAALNPVRSLVWGNNHKDSASYTLVAGRNNVIAPLASHSAVVGSGNKSNGGYNFIAGAFNTASGALNLISGQNNTTLYPSSSYNIIGGWDNSVYGEKSIVAGYSNIAWDASNSAVFGASNKDSANYTLVAGSSNILATTAGSSSVTGNSNLVTGFATVVGGQGNKDSANYSTVSGINNTLAPATQNSAVFGVGNNLLGQSNGSIVAGIANTVSTTSGGANAVAGRNNQMNGTTVAAAMFGGDNVLNSGAYSAVFGNNNKDSASYTLVAGLGNAIAPSATHSIVAGNWNVLRSGYSNAVFGEGNNLNASSYHTIVSGRENVTTATASQGSAILGIQNTLGGNVSYANAMFGNQNRITGTVKASENIVAGNLNSIVDASASAVLGASNKDSASYTLVVGEGNTVSTTMPHATVVGRYNLPAANALLTVGNGTSASAQSNALLVLSDGKVVAPQIPVYSGDSAADADASLPSGGIYKTTPGGRMLFIKP